MSTRQQQLLANQVNRLLPEIHPGSKAIARPKDMLTTLQPKMDVPLPDTMTQKVANVFREMDEAALGQVVRQAEAGWAAYIRSRPDSSLVDLAQLGITIFRAAAIAVIQGGPRHVPAGVQPSLKAFENAVLLTINGEITALNDPLHRRIEELETEVGMLLPASEEAQREATEARRQVEAASAQLIREREAHARELAELKAAHATNVTGLQQQLSRAARLSTDQERQWNEQRRQLQADLATAQASIAYLNAECDRLDALRSVKTELNLFMEAQPPKTALEVASFTNFMRVTLNDPGFKMGQGTPITATQVSDWRAAYPTEASQLAQVRAAVMKGKAA